MMDWVYKYLYGNLKSVSALVQPLINLEILLLVNSVYRNMPPTFMQTRGNIKVVEKPKAKVLFAQQLNFNPWSDRGDTSICVCFSFLYFYRRTYGKQDEISKAHGTEKKTPPQRRVTFSYIINQVKICG